MTVRPTSRFSTPGLALLAPAAERRRWTAMEREPASSRDSLRPRRDADRFKGIGGCRFSLVGAAARASIGYGRADPVWQDLHKMLRRLLHRIWTLSQRERFSIGNRRQIQGELSLLTARMSSCCRINRWQS